MRNLILVLALTLAAASQAHAWGGYHRGYTVHTPSGGYYHHGQTAVAGPYGAHASSHSYGYNPATGGYHSGGGASYGAGGSAYHYSSGAGGYGGYHGGAYGRYGGYAGYGGAYRRW